MSKTRLKPDQPTTHYHVMTRCAQKAFLIQEDTFKEEVAGIIHDFAEIYFVDVHGWTVLDNHYHLAIKVTKPQKDTTDLERRFNLLQAKLKRPKKWRKWLDPKKYYRRFTDLSKFMWEINRRIAVAYNNNHQTWGHFWGARFKSKVIEDEAALLRVLAYLEQNSVRAGLAEEPSSYPHCSAGRMKQELAAGQQPVGPAISWFATLLEKYRAPAYLAWNDYLAYLIHYPEKATIHPPSDVIMAQFRKKEVDEICTELRAGTPSDWSTPGYGSPTFVKHLVKRSTKKKPRKRNKAGPPEPV